MKRTKATPAPKPVTSSPRHRSRYKENRKAKTVRNAELCEHRARTALVLGGGAPNMALMAGAVAAFHDCGVEFDVVSTSGAGGLAGLLWLAPKGKSPKEALHSVVTMSVVDQIYSLLPVNYKVFNKPGTWADLWRKALAANPFFKMDQHLYERWPPYALWYDSMMLWAASFCPSDLNWTSRGLCAPVPFIEQIIDFARIPDIKPHFYLNAYNITQERIDDFSKDVITPDHFRAALAFPFIYGPYRLNGDQYYEGAVVDCLNFKDLTERHDRLRTIVVLDVLGNDKLIRAPRDLYDSWVLSTVIPLVETAEDDIELFALKYNKGWHRSRGAKADLLKVEFDIPKEDLVKVLDWSASNATRLFEIGYKAGQSFSKAHADKLTFAGASA
jgi:predicted acylesterase/phospholipase RssA